MNKMIKFRVGGIRNKNMKKGDEKNHCAKMLKMFKLISIHSEEDLKEGDQLICAQPRLKIFWRNDQWSVEKWDEKGIMGVIRMEEADEDTKKWFKEREAHYVENEDGVDKSSNEQGE